MVGEVAAPDRLAEAAPDALVAGREVDPRAVAALEPGVERAERLGATAPVRLGAIDQCG